MATDDIIALPETDDTFPAFADDAILFLWTTPPMLFEGLKICEGWGFVYKTIAFAWVKQTQEGGIYLGIGNYTRSNHELCLIAKSGKGLPRKDNTISNVQLAKRLGHSEKPHLFRELIERMYGDVKRVELFARRTSPGWDTWGNQIEAELF